MTDEMHRSGPSAPSLAVDPGCHAPAGDSGTLRVHVRNVADLPQSFTVTLLGLEQSWVPAPALLMSVEPGATVTFEIPVSPVPGTTPGDYPFVVVVEARPAGALGPAASAEPAKTILSTSLTVDNRSDVVLTVEPADARGIFSKPVQVVIANSGHGEAEVHLTTKPEKGISVQLDRRTVRLAPHQTARVRGRVRTRRPRVVGHAARDSYVVTATGTLAPQRFQASFHSRPLLSSGAMKVLALVMVAVLWVGGTVAVLPWVSAKVKSATLSSGTTSTEVARVPATDGGGTAGDGSGTGDGSGDGGSTGSDGSGSKGGGKKDGGKKGEDGTDAAADGVRISGAITATDPSGVTVSVSPASVDTTGATSSGSSSESASTSTAGSTSHAETVAWRATGVRAHVALAEGTSRAGASTAGTSTAATGTSAASPTTTPATTTSGSATNAGKVWGTAVPIETAGTASQSRSTTTGEDGTWAVAGLSSTGRYLVVLTKAGYQTQRYLVTGATAAATPLETTLVPGEGSLSGTVTGPSGKVGGVTLTITDGTTTVTTRSATTGKVGSWSVTGLTTPSTYIVTASSDSLGAQSRLVTLAASGSASVDLTLQRGVATLRGTVKGTNRLGTFGGLGGMTVTATDGTTTRTASTTTAETNTGSFILPDLPVPGTYTVTVTGDGYLTQVRKVRLTTKRSSTSITIQTQSDGGSVTGTVVDENAAGLGGAGLTLSNDAETYKTMSASDGAGSFRFDGIAPGTYVLSGQAFGHETAFAKVKVTYGGTTTTTLTLTSIPGNGLVATSYIRGRVTDATTGGVITCPHIRDGEDCRLTATTTATASDGTTRNLSVEADPDQQYLLPPSTEGGLLPGRYTITVTAPGYEASTVTVELAMGTVAEAATVALQPSPSITGNVQARVGTLPQGVCVIAVAQGVTLTAANLCSTVDDECVITPAVDGAYCGYVDTAHMGSYEISRLPSGTYTVWTLPPASSEYISDAPDQPGGTGGVTISLSPGDVKRYDPTLDRLGRIALTIEASAGNGTRTPANQATVKALLGGTEVASLQTDENGLVSFTRLQPGSYTFTAELGNVSGTLTSLQVGYNQEITSQLVMTAGVATFTPKVVYQLDAGGGTPVSGTTTTVTVTVTGTTGYRGTTPIRTTATSVTTTSNGNFTVCTDVVGCATSATTTALPLVEDRVDLTITATGFQDYTANDVPTSDLAIITLTPSGVHFDGQVTLTGLGSPLPSNTETLLSQVRYTVTQAPPGAGAVSLTTSTAALADPQVATKPVVWSDSTQPTDGAGRLLRPGTYEVTASLAGFDSVTKTFTVEAGETMPQVTFELKKYGQLRVRAVTAGTTTGITNTVMTITLADGTTRTVTADAGNDYVDFGTLATGEYPVQIRAAGYLTDNHTVEVAPGSTTTTPQVVPVTRLSAVTGTVVSQLEAGWTQVLSGATVTASLGSSSTSFQTSSGTDGGFRVTGTTTADGLIAGSWTVGATMTGYNTSGSGTSTPSSVTMSLPLTNGTGTGTGNMDFPVSTTDNVLTLTPKPGTLNVSVLDENLDPVTNDVSATLTYNDGTHTPINLTPSCSQDTTNCPGVYQFANLKPLTYTLNLWSSGRAPVSMSVTIGADTTTPITVQLTQPAGSIQGIVTMQTIAGSPVVDNATVTLSNTGGTVATTHTTANGAYSLSNVAPGSYTLTAEKDGQSVARNIVITAAQSVTVDLAIVVQTQSVTVTLTSTHGYDLTGALVSLKEDGAPSGSTAMELAPQPAVRSGSTFVVTFSQVPAASWTATVSGPTGHLGRTTKDFTSSATAATPVAITVDETQVRLSAQTSISSAAVPSTLTATLTQDSAHNDVTVPVGGEAIVYVPNAATTVTGTIAGGWSLTTSPTNGAVPAGAVSAAVVFTITQPATTTTITTTGTPTVTLPANGGAGTLNLAFTVTSGGSAVTAGTVSAYLDGSSTAVATEDADDSPIQITVPAGTTPGSHQVTLKYTSGSGGVYADSSSAAKTFTVAQAVTVSLTLSGTTLTATVAPASLAGHGTLVFQRSANGTNGWTTLDSTCTTSSAVTATCTAPTAGTADIYLRASWTGATGWPSGTSTNVKIDAAPSGGGGGGGGGTGG